MSDEIRVPVYVVTLSGLVFKHMNDGHLVYDKIVNNSFFASQNEKGVVLCCGHSFYLDHLVAWLSEKPKEGGKCNNGCPICEAKIVATFCACGCSGTLH